MEVASPLPLSHGRTGTKRSFCSPSFAAESVPFAGSQEDCSMAMDESSGFGNQPFKRRRFLATETKNESCKSSFPIFASSSTSSTQGSLSSTAQPSNKRFRGDNGWNQVQAKQQIALELQRVVDQQAAEIDRLKSEKQSVESSYAELKSQHDKISGENRILKKAVTIQQERQNQAVQEIEAACKYRAEAEERIRKLEQMNLTLQYHLQRQSSCNGNDFMGFNPRPPDVF